MMSVVLLLVDFVGSISFWENMDKDLDAPRYLLPKQCPPYSGIPDSNQYKLQATEATEVANIIAKGYQEYSKEVRFYLYTRIRPYSSEELKIGDSSSVLQSNFDFSKRTCVIIHGWTCNGTGFPADIIKDAYLGQINLNIISVDWASYANKIYLVSRVLVPSIGRITADFMAFLISLGVYPNDVHLIGHGLGAHIAGIVSKRLHYDGKQIHAITGLDPAMPLFDLNDTESRLDKSDAHYVQVLHTNGEMYGMISSIGHVDFYFNGGKMQPGCRERIDYGLSCSHRRAVEYFAESISSSVSPFYAVLCSDWNEVYSKGYCKPHSQLKDKVMKMDGLRLNCRDQGVYYLPTGPMSPYVLGDPQQWQLD